MQPHLAFPQVLKNISDVFGAGHGVIHILLVDVDIVVPAAAGTAVLLLLLLAIGRGRVGSVWTATLQGQQTSRAGW